MKKRLTAIAICVMIVMALPVVAQPPDGNQGYGMVPPYHHGPDAGYGPGRQGGQTIPFMARFWC